MNAYQLGKRERKDRRTVAEVLRLLAGRECAVMAEWIDAPFWDQARRPNRETVMFACVRLEQLRTRSLFPDGSPAAILRTLDRLSQHEPALADYLRMLREHQ